MIVTPCWRSEQTETYGAMWEMCEKEISFSGGEGREKQGKTGTEGYFFYQYFCKKGKPCSFPFYNNLFIR
jgi:hypothetical protein